MPTIATIGIIYGCELFGLFWPFKGANLVSIISQRWSFILVLDLLFVHCLFNGRRKKS